MSISINNNKNNSYKFALFPTLMIQEKVSKLKWLFWILIKFKFIHYLEIKFALKTTLIELYFSHFFLNLKYRVFYQLYILLKLLCITCQY